MIEILASIERIEADLDDPDLFSEDLRADAGINSLRGVGVSEAPRGTLFHDYTVDRQGLLTEGEPDRRDGAEQPGDESDRGADRAALRARQRYPGADAQPDRAWDPLLRPLPELLDPRAGKDAPGRPLNRRGRFAAARSCPGMNAAAEDARPFLVIGYGNTLRGDDGAGPRVAETIESRQIPGVRTMSLGLLTPEIADPVSRAEKVVFVDASSECEVMQLLPVGPAVSSQIMAHAADPRTVLALARDLFGRTPEAFILAIPAHDFSPGERLSEKTTRGVEQAVTRITSMAKGRE